MSPLGPLAHPLLVAGDPLYMNGVGWAVFLIVLIKVLVIFGALMVSVMLMIWFERKVISDMQSRIGPNRAGPFGIAQTLADGIKLFFKEDLMPDRADRPVFILAPYLTIVTAFLAFAIVPFGGVVTVAGHTFELQLADPPWASSSSSPCPPSVSTGSCWPGGRRVRSTRCSARCGRRPK